MNKMSEAAFAGAWRHPSFRIGITGATLFVAIALISAFWTPHQINEIDISVRFAPPGANYWLGTDFFGRDMVSMLMSGAFSSISVAVLAVLIGMLIGVPLGLTAAVYGGSLEWILLKFSDFLFAFPALISAILITTLFGPGAINAMIAIGIFNIPVFARVARGGAMTVLSLDYVGAARMAGLSPLAIALKHLLPNITGLLIVQASIQLSLGILAEAALSYIGLGTQPPATSLGLMLKEAQSFFLLNPMLSIWPGLAIVWVVISINMAGDGLRDVLDPRLKRGATLDAAG